MATRTFFALDLDDHVRDRLVDAQQRLDCTSAKVRWVARQQLHVTLQFLGDVDDDTIGRVCSLAAEAAVAVEPFDFHVRRIICVPPGGRMRMFWAGAIDPTGRLAQLHAGLADALGQLGFQRESRGFKPHVTMARIKFANARGSSDLRAAAADLADEDFGTQHAVKLTAYASRLTPQGPRYTPLATPTLGG